MDLHCTFIFLISWTVNVIKAFKAPSQLHANVLSSHEISVTWEEHKRWRDKNDTFYILRFRPRNGGQSQYDYIRVHHPEHLLSDVTPNTTYALAVKFAKGKKRSRWSSTVKNTTSVLEVTPTEAPIPRSLEVKSLTSSIVKVKWRRPKIKKSDVLAYRVLWTNGRPAQERAANISKRFYIIAGLKLNSTYTIKVQTLCADGRTSNFSSVTFRTQNDLVKHSPSNITARAVGTTQILVKWQPPVNGQSLVTGYKLQYRRKGLRRGDMCSVITESSKRKYVITDLFKDETYKIRVGARTNDKTGPYTPWQIVDLDRYRRNRKKGNSDTSFPVTDDDVIEVDFRSVMPTISPLKRAVNVSWPVLNGTAVKYEFTVTRGEDTLETVEFRPEEQGSLLVKGLKPGTIYNITVKVTVTNPIAVRLDRILAFTTLKTLTVTLINLTNESDDSDFRLECQASGSSIPTIQWKKGSKELYRNSSDVSIKHKKNGNYKLTFQSFPPNRLVSVLTVYNVSASDQGRYRCIATDGNDRKTDTYHLSLKLDPLKRIGVTSISSFGAKIYISPSRRFRRVNMTYILYSNLDPPRFHTDQGKTYYKFDSLEPDTVYTVLVQAEGYVGATNHTQTFTTKRLSVLHKDNVAVKAINATTLVITWKCPTKYDSHVTYRIVYTVKGTNTSDGHVMDVTDNETATLTGLLANRLYNICVEMRRKENTVSAVFVEGSTYPDAYLNSNAPPTPPADVFIDVRNDTLVVSWLDPHSEYRTLVEWFEIEVFREAEVIERRRVKANVKEIAITPADVNSEFTVIVRASNRAGDSDEVIRVYRPGDFHETSDYSVTSLTATATGSTTILLEWSPPTSGELTRYLLRYRPNIKVGLNSSDIIDQWVPRADNSYVISGLTPTEEYAISVIPYLNDINGNTSTVYVKTYSDVPGTAPQNFTASLVNMTSISVTWYPPVVSSWYGALTGYMVLHRREGENVINKKFLDVTYRLHVIKGLAQGTVYEVAVSAMNQNGTGRASAWAPITTDIDPASLKAPSSPTNFSVTSHNMGLHLTWSSPNDVTVPVTGYVVGYGRFIPEVYRQILDTTQTEHTITGLRQNSDYIVSIRAFNKFGESRPVFKLGRAGRRSSPHNHVTTAQPEEPTEVLPDAPGNLKVRETNDEVVTLKVTWSPPRVLNGELTGYHLYYTTDKTFSPENDAFVYEKSESTTLKNLEFNTTYYFRVEANFIEGTGRSSHVVAFTTKPPDNSLHILPTPTVTSVSSGTDYIRVTWLPPPPHYSHVIRGYIVGYGIVQPNEQQAIMPMSIHSYTLDSLRSSTLYHISLRMFNELGESAQTFVNGTTLG